MSSPMEECDIRCRFAAKSLNQHGKGVPVPARLQRFSVECGAAKASTGRGSDAIKPTRANLSKHSRLSCAARPPHGVWGGSTERSEVGVGVLQFWLSTPPAALSRHTDEPARHHGALTPRQRPYRHGKYQHAPAGLVCGTMSMPDVPQGRQRNTRASVIHVPPHNPNRSIASSP
jgi:hypothetical protein